MPSVKELRDKAKDLEIKNASKLRKMDLIHAIQSAEGNSPCYGMIPDCGQQDCWFYPECVAMPIGG